MKTFVSQIYIEPGVRFPFTHHFQRFISKELSKSVTPSAQFIQKYGEDYDLTFNMSAKKRIDSPEVRGPLVFKRDKDVEYSIFLPFDQIMAHEQDCDSVALRILLEEIIGVLQRFSIDTTPLARNSSKIITHILADPKMREGD